MVSGHWREPFVIEETEALPLGRVDAQHDTLSLRNRTGKEVNELALAEHLAKIAGIQRITSLIVEPSSMVKNLLFLTALPSLETAQLNGLQLRTLDGLEWFRRGRFLQIDTGRNSKRIIEKIAETTITRLSLRWANAGDLGAVGRSSTISELLLSNSPNIPSQEWGSVPLQTLSLFKGGMPELGDLRHLSRLEKLTLYDCRKLERFVGDNGNVRWIVAQACNQLDLSTISTFRGLEFASFVGINREQFLSSFAGMPRLRELSFVQCKVTVDLRDLKSSSPNLEKLTISKLASEEAIALSNANPDVVVSDSTRSYKNGEAA